jgi:hypothetical protein
MRQGPGSEELGECGYEEKRVAEASEEDQAPHRTANGDKKVKEVTNVPLIHRHPHTQDENRIQNTETKTAASLAEACGSVQALLYKPEDHGFDTQWDYWNFQLT